MDISFLGKENYKIKSKQGVVLASTKGLKIQHKNGGEDFLVNDPGEYEVEGISVFGYKYGDTKIYVVQFEDIRVLYVGQLDKVLPEKAITDLESIDVVIIPTDVLAVKDTIELVSKLEPYYILPYGEMVEKFVSSYEHGSRSVKSLTLTKSTLPDDLTEVIVFDPSA